jgi:two-component system, LytTR family, sensor histidine kinase AgrC
MNAVIDTIGNIFELYIIVEYFKLIFGTQRISGKLPSTIVIFCVLLSFALSAFWKLDPAVLLVISLLSYFGISFIYSGNVIIRIFSCLLIYVFFLALDIINGLILSRIYNMSVDILQSIPVCYIQGVMLSKFGVFIIVKILGLLKRNKAKHINSSSIILLTFFPVASILSICTISFFTYKATEYIILFLSYISISSLILSNILIFYVFERQSKLELEKNRFDFMQNQLARQKEHYQELYNTQKETRRIWHDMKNSLIAISGYLEVGKNEQAIEYINDLTGTNLKAIQILDTGCPAIDVILNSKLKRAESSGIDLQYKIVLPEKLSIEPIDFAVLLANGLDNAIEAVEKLEKPNMIIMLNIMPREDYVFIKITNPISNNIDVLHLETVKPDKLNHGYGLNNIGLIAQKYSGDVNIESRDLNFYLSVVLKNK